MSAFYRTLTGIVALGAGVVSMGLSPGLPLPAAVVLALAGISQLALAISILSGARTRNFYISIALAPSIAWLVVLTFVPTAGQYFTSFALGALLNVVFALLLVAPANVKQRAPKSGAAFLGVAALVGVLTGFTATPALAASAAGVRTGHSAMSTMSGMHH